MKKTPVLGTKQSNLSSGRQWPAGLRLVLALASISLSGCDAFNPLPLIGTITLAPRDVLLESIGDTVRFTATAQDRNGVTIPLPALEWRSGDEAVATVDASGLAVAVGSGTTTITAFVGPVVGSATLEVFLDPLAGNFIPGRIYFGRLQYTEYQSHLRTHVAVDWSAVLRSRG